MREIRRSKEFRLLGILVFLVFFSGCNLSQVPFAPVSISVDVGSTALSIADVTLSAESNSFFSDANLTQPIDWSEYLSIPGHKIVKAVSELGGIRLTLDSPLSPSTDTTMDVNDSKVFYGDQGGTIPQEYQYRFTTSTVTISYH